MFEYDNCSGEKKKETQERNEDECVKVAWGNLQHYIEWQIWSLSEGESEQTLGRSERGTYATISEKAKGTSNVRLQEEGMLKCQEHHKPVWLELWDQGEKQKEMRSNN